MQLLNGCTLACKRICICLLCECEVDGNICVQLLCLALIAVGGGGDDRRSHTHITAKAPPLTIGVYREKAWREVKESCTVSRCATINFLVAGARASYGNRMMQFLLQ